MIKKRTLKKEKIKRQYKRKIEKSKKKKRSKKGLLRTNQKSNKRSIKNSPNTKLKKVQHGGGSSCGSKPKIKEIRKFIDKTQKQFNAVTQSTKMFIDELQLERQYETLKEMYNLEKIKHILTIQKIILNKRVPGLDTGKDEKKLIVKDDMDTSGLKSIDSNQSELSSITTLLREIDIELSEKKNLYQGFAKTNKEEINDYKIQDIQRKKNLNKYYKQVYKYYTGKNIKKFNYENNNEFNIVQMINETSKKPINNKKNKYKEGKTNGEKIAFYKIKLGDTGENKIKSLEEIETLSKAGAYNKLKKMKAFHKRLAKCSDDWIKKIKIHNELFQSMRKIIEEDNNLQREMGNMSSHINKIEIKIGTKSKTTLENIFQHTNGNYIETNGVTAKCINAIFYLAPIDIDEKIAEKNKRDIDTFKEEQKKVIDYGKLKEIQDKFERATRIVNEMDIAANITVITPGLNRANDMFKNAKKLYDGIKADLKSFKQSFFFIGRDKARGINPTSHLLKQISGILSAHYEALLTINLVKCYMDTFINEDYKMNFLQYFLNTTQDLNTRARYQNELHESQKIKNTLRGGSLFQKKPKQNKIFKNILTQDIPNISYIYGSILNFNYDTSTIDDIDELYSNIKYTQDIDSLKEPYNYPEIQGTEYRIIKDSKTYINEIKRPVAIVPDNINDYLIALNRPLLTNLKTKKISVLLTSDIKHDNKIKNSIFIFFYLIETYKTDIVNSTHFVDYHKKFAQLTVFSIFIKRVLNTDTTLTTTINKYELEGQIDNLFNWFIYIAKLIKKLKIPNIDIDTIPLHFNSHYFDKNIVECFSYI